MSVTLCLHFDRAVPNTVFSDSYLDGGGKWFRVLIWRLDEICDVIGIQPFSRFYLGDWEHSVGIWFDAEDGLDSIAHLVPWVETEEDNERMVHALSVLAGDLELARKQNARFIIYDI